MAGRLLRLGDAMGYAVLAQKMATGENVGTILDPRHPSPPEAKKRKAKK